MTTTIEPVHPGEILREEFLAPLEMSGAALARAIDVPALRLNRVLQGKRGISGDLALRLAAYFDTTPEFWMNLQSHFDLETARDRLGPALESLPRGRTSR